MKLESAIVRLFNSTARRLLAAGVVLVVLAFIAWLCLQANRAHRAVPSHSYKLQTGEMGAWKAFGGNWKVSDGVISNDHSYLRGAKLVTGSNHWENYTLTADISFEKDGGDMGTIVRSNDEQEGIDSYNGYYIGLRVDEGSLIIGRSDYGWIEARPVAVPGGVHPFVWYRLRATAYKCNIAASIQNLETLQTAWIAFEERSCVKTGRIGLREVDAGGRWRNVSIAPAGWNDYLELRKHAAFVEQPVVLPGPPWWTPWHVGMLFTGILVFALLAQLTYFRFQQWKTFTITQERQRLAHEIHDTMAQSFAGIGYQIQGIRSGLLRGDRHDPGHIVDQLGIAYQLIRRCHAEASETIAMLGSSPPGIQQNLLEKLAETAHKIAGSPMKIVTRYRGDSSPLDLRTADALLHIGEEAIANAVIHSDPTILTITLSFEDGTVELVVEDNGRGFNYSSETAGFGILGMQKRARDVAGQFQIFSTLQSGTRVCIKTGLRQRKLRRRLFTKIKTPLHDAPTDLDAG
jgi:signal transduction histidine kinase